jgi:alcohol dehydrogenase (cytochrome c)
VCPASGGGTNWMSAAYSPALKYFYFQANETCSVYRKNAEQFELGKRFFGGTTSFVPGSRNFMRALDLHTGKTMWDYELVGGRTQSGTLSTAGGLVFFGDAPGEFTALDAKTGKRLWHFNAGQGWRASPMTYQVAGKQYVAIAGAAGVFTFALPGN